MKRALLLAFLLPLSAFAQQSDPASFLLRAASGTASNAGPSTQLVLGSESGWSAAIAGAAFGTHVLESGPEPAHSQTFSTNWLSAALSRNVGDRAVFAVRLRGSLEPWSMEDGRHLQLLQHVGSESGGPLLDQMRAHRAIGEAAVAGGLRLGRTVMALVYAGALGDPALGAVPFAQRSSASDFAEAPYAYDIQESFHEATRVVTAGLTSRFATIEGSVFHDASALDAPYRAIGDGPIDSHSARLTITPLPQLAIQYSTGTLGDARLKVASASASIGTPAVSATALWTRRDLAAGAQATAIGAELQLRSERNSVMARVESIDKPANRAIAPALARLTHCSVGYIFEAVRARGWRAGVGVNADYHPNFREFDPRYGHKPQTLYLFARIRTDSGLR